MHYCQSKFAIRNFMVHWLYVTILLKNHICSRIFVLKTLSFQSKSMRRKLVKTQKSSLFQLRSTNPQSSLILKSKLYLIKIWIQITRIQLFQRRLSIYTDSRLKSVLKSINPTITTLAFISTMQKTKGDVLTELGTVLIFAQSKDASVIYPTIYLNSCTIH